jgi:hypothetical protein
MIISLKLVKTSGETSRYLSKEYIRVEISTCKRLRTF